MFIWLLPPWCQTFRLSGTDQNRDAQYNFCISLKFFLCNFVNENFQFHWRSKRFYNKSSNKNHPNNSDTVTFVAASTHQSRDRMRSAKREPESGSKQGQNLRSSEFCCFWPNSMNQNINCRRVNNLSLEQIRYRLETSSWLSLLCWSVEQTRLFRCAFVNFYTISLAPYKCTNLRIFYFCTYYALQLNSKPRIGDMTYTLKTTTLLLRRCVISGCHCFLIAFILNPIFHKTLIIDTAQYEGLDT